MRPIMHAVQETLYWKGQEATDHLFNIFNRDAYFCNQPDHEDPWTSYLSYIIDYLVCSIIV